ncbi:MAG: hypothetical protein ACI841_003535 [Planctomycetota bacterium]|jgi:hypothetical protein
MNRSNAIRPRRVQLSLAFVFCILFFGSTLIATAASSRRSLAEKPFPIGKTTTLREESAQYTIEGRQVIKKNVKIVSLRQMQLTGIGENPTLVVEGVLDFRAVTGGWARISNLTIELAPSAKELVLMDVELGRGGHVRPSDQGPADAKVNINGSKVLSGGSIELLMDAGKVAVMGTLATGPITIRGAMRSETKGSNVEVLLVSNGGAANGIRGGLIIAGVKSATLRLNDFAGERITLENIEKLDFTANNVRCKNLEFRHDKGGRLPKANIEANDFRCRTIMFLAPSKSKTQVERLSLSNNWFGGLKDEDAVREKLIQDSETHPESGVLVRIKKIAPVALGLGGRLE